MVKTNDFLQFTSVNSKFGVYKLQDPIAVHVIDKYCLCALFSIFFFQRRQFPLYIFV